MEKKYVIVGSMIKKLANDGNLCKIYVKSVYNIEEDNTVTTITKYVLSDKPLILAKKFKDKYLNKEIVSLNMDTLNYISCLSINHDRDTRKFYINSLTK